MHMIIFAGPKLKFLPKKTGFARKFSSDIRSAAGELFTGRHQSLSEMFDGPTAIGEHCDMPGRTRTWSSSHFYSRYITVNLRLKYV